MSIIQGNAKQGSTRGFYDFPLEQSLRFNDDDSAYLDRSVSTSGNLRKWTVSCWVKRGALGGSVDRYLFTQTNEDGSGADIKYTIMRFTTADKLELADRWGSSPGDEKITTTAVFRDPSAWYHVVFVRDSDNATAADRAIIYVNGVRQEVTGSYTQSKDSSWNKQTTAAYGQEVSGRFRFAGTWYYGSDFYLAEVNSVDGQALDADSFGELKNGVWIPKNPSGLTYGTNGFRLSFADDAEVEAFNTVLYRGNGGTQSVTGMGFQPDLVWFKSRSASRSHGLIDSVRGRSKVLFPDLTLAELTSDSTKDLVSFDSDGFTVGAVQQSGSINTNNDSIVAWGWKAGDSNVSNTDGSITSTVRANDTYGFSIVSTENHTGSQTVGHGLSSAPDWIVAKARNGALLWPVYHSALGNTKRLRLNDTTAAETNAVWGNTDPTTSVFTFNQSSSTYNYIFYCWAEKAGYSKFGSYEGNNTATGPTVTTTFKPALVIIKNADGTGNWNLFDNTRATFPDNDLFLRANLSAAEVDGSAEGGDAYEVEFTDTGFIPKASGASSRSQVNGTGTYIYAAFADTREAAFWLDQSGNDNDWQPVNLDHNDTVADSPTDNFATLNPLQMSNNDGNFFLSNGNLQLNSGNNDAYRNVSATFSPEGFKGYLEVTYLNTPNSKVGFEDVLYAPNKNGYAESTYDTVHIANNGDLKNNTTTLTSGITGAFGTGDVLNIAFDFTNGNRNVWFGKNGDYGTGNPSAGTGAHVTSATLDANEYRFYFAVNNGCDISVNFGQQPFKYDPPA